MLAASGILWGLKEPLCAKPRPSPVTTWASRPGLQEATFPRSPVDPLCPVLGAGEGRGRGGHFAMTKQQWQTLLSAPQHLLSPHPQYGTLILWSKDTSQPPHSARKPRGRQADTSGLPGALPREGHLSSEGALGPFPSSHLESRCEGGGPSHHV